MGRRRTRRKGTDGSTYFTDRKPNRTEPQTPSHVSPDLATLMMMRMRPTRVAMAMILDPKRQGSGMKVAGLLRKEDEGRWMDGYQDIESTWQRMSIEIAGYHSAGLWRELEGRRTTWEKLAGNRSTKMCVKTIHLRRAKKRDRHRRVLLDIWRLASGLWASIDFHHKKNK